MDLRIGINIEEHLFHGSQHQIHTGRVFRRGTVGVALPVAEQETINGLLLGCLQQFQPGGPFGPAAARNAETLGIRIAIDADPHAVSDFLKAFGYLVLVNRTHGKNLSILIESFFPADNFTLGFQLALASQRKELKQNQ